MGVKEKDIVNLTDMDGGLFSYKTPVCKSYFSTLKDKYGKSYYVIKIQKTEKNRCYCFTTDGGLEDVNVKKLSQDNKDDDTAEEDRNKTKRSARTRSIITEIPASPEIVNRISLYNILTELRIKNSEFEKIELRAKCEDLFNRLEMRLPKKYNKEYMTTLYEYLNKYGYLFGAPKHCTSIPVDQLAAFYDRLYVVMTLISELQATEVFQNADTLLFCSTYLLNAPPKKAISYLGKKTEPIVSHSHKFHEIWKNALSKEFEFQPGHYSEDDIPEKQIRITHAMDDINKNYYKYCNFKPSADIVPYPYEFEKIVYDSLEKEKVYFSFSTITGIKKHTTKVIFEYDESSDCTQDPDEDISGDVVGEELIWPTLENQTFFEKMCNLYACETLEPDIKEIVDILMRLYCVFPEMKESECGGFYFPGEGINASSFLSLKHKHKELLVRLAKKVLQDEMNYHLSQIHPAFNTDKMSPDWYIPDLLSAMYFSIFYMNPQHKIFKPCARTDCSNFIIVNDSNFLLKYCTDGCKNIVTQRNKRRKEKEINLYKTIKDKK